MVRLRGQVSSTRVENAFMAAGAEQETAMLRPVLVAAALMSLSGCVVWDGVVGWFAPSLSLWPMQSIRRVGALCAVEQRGEECGEDRHGMEYIVLARGQRMARFPVRRPRRKSIMRGGSTDAA
jgi:hypothetical protein